MLSVFYGDMPEAIYDPVVYFKNTYTDEWITDELSRERQDQQILVIADGATFGPEMDRVMKLIRQRKGIVLYLPESFEWLTLNSGVVTEKNLNRILETPEDFIESSQYFSWERFFTDLLVSATKDTYLQYSKRKLNEVYLHKDISEKIAEQMPGISCLAK